MIWPFFLPLWFVAFGTICALMLRAKGYEWWLGVLLGTFGPFGILIAALIKPAAANAIPPPVAGTQWAPEAGDRLESQDPA